MLRYVALAVMVASLGLALAPTTALAQKDKDKAKKGLTIKKIQDKLDPEIRAARIALDNARAKLKRAIADEVFTEKGGVQGKVIDKLKAAIRAVDNAIELTKEAQKIDDGKGD